MGLALPGCGALFLEPMAAYQDGAVLEVEPEGQVEFGQISPHGSPTTQEMYLLSAGSEGVAAEDVTIDQDGGGVFTLLFDPTPTVIAPGESAPVEIRFRPDAAGSYNGRVTVMAVIDGEEWEVTRRLIGSGCADNNRDGECAGGSQPGWDPIGPGPEDSGGW